MNTPPNLRIEHLHTYVGPSIHADEPVIVTRLTMDPELLLDAGARISRMSEGSRAWFEAPSLPDELTVTDVGQYLVTWARCALTEVRGVLNVAKAVLEREGVLLIIGYHDPRVSLGALKLAGTIFCGSTTEHMASALSKLWDICRKHHPDYQSAILMTAAHKAAIPFLRFSQLGLYQYGWGARGRVFQESASTADSMIGNQVSTNKASCKALFRSMGVPTPMHAVIDAAFQLEKAISIVGYPCVIKPLKGSKGTAVTVCIEDLERARVAFDAAQRANAGPVMIEQFVKGDDHRLMVIGGKCVAVIRREPPVVVGDGQRTVRELMDVLNAPRSQNIVRSRYMRPVLIDDVVLECLRAQGIAPDFVPAAGRRIQLRTNANLSTGGGCIDVTAQAHPSLKAMAEQLATSMGLSTAGLDYVTPDITQSPWHSGGAFIEANSTPGLCVVIAGGGSTEHLGRMVLGEDVGRIPVSLIVAESSPKPGDLDPPRAPGSARVIGNEVHTDASVYRVNASAPWAAVRAALCNRGVHELEIFSTPAQIIAYGLPVDRLDRTVLMNVHLPDPWREVIKRCSRTVEVSPNYAEALSA